MREEDLMEQIRQRAAAYVPEWGFDRENPDMGVALARVFARMQGKTEGKYDRLMEKYQRDFFNCLNTSMRGSAPAGGYAVFGLSDGSAGGTELPAGTRLRTDAQDEAGERIPAETTEDVYVIPDTLEAVYECSDEADYIGLLYEKGRESRSFSLFAKESENLQEHVFYLGHSHILSIRDHAVLRLTFLGQGGKELEEETICALADPEKTEFFYLTREGDEIREIPFAPAWREGKTLCLEKQRKMPPWEETELLEKRSCWLGCRILDKKPLESLSLGEVYVASECRTAQPELFYADGAEKRGGIFYPFGEQPSLYGELYLCSDEVFGKKGAAVELSFEQEFDRIPISAPAREALSRWKLVMPKEDMAREKEYEITIEEVVWEYFNGLGWTSLFADGRYSDLFSGREGRYRREIRLAFTCPEDIHPVLVGASEGYWIRGRIRRMNHAFKTSGFYITPVLSGAALRYRYETKQFRPDAFVLKNNSSVRLLPASRVLGQFTGFAPIEGTGEKSAALYLGFEEPVEQGPVRILWMMEQDYERGFLPLSWEYFGGGRWRSLSPADGTGNFSKTGTITFSGMPKAEKKRLFERELYWIRALDREGGFGRDGAPKARVKGFWLNAARAVTVQTGLSERLTMENYRGQESFRLLNRNIHRLEVWVMENRLHGEEELSRLQKEGRLERVLDEDGMVRETWVKWQETDSFLCHMPTDRCYMLDANEGILTFGGGAHGAIPAPGVPGGIQVRYSVGGGESCNLLPGQIAGLELAAGFVNAAFNPLALSGGYGRETAGEAMERAGRERKHRFGAVAEADYGALAREATRNIEKARCFSCRDLTGEERPGCVTLVILKKDYRSGGRFFEEMKEQIRDYLADKLPVAMIAGEQLFIREPVLVEMELRVTAKSRGSQDLFGLRRRILERVKQFLDPVSGNFDGKGWEIGTLPDRVQLETVMRSVPGLLELTSLVIFTRILKEPEAGAKELEELQAHPYVLPVSGSHTILVQAGE